MDIAQVSQYKGNPLIVIPTPDGRRVQFGVAKARMITEQFEQLSAIVKSGEGYTFHIGGKFPKDWKVTNMQLEAIIEAISDVDEFLSMYGKERSY